MLGGGMTMQKGAREEPVSARNRARSSQNRRQRGSTLLGSNDFSMIEDVEVVGVSLRSALRFLLQLADAALDDRFGEVGDDLPGYLAHDLLRETGHHLAHGALDHL